MNLLPKSREEFSQKEYWDAFFKKRTKAIEWYGEYPELAEHLHKYIKPQDAILIPGCGNSTLGKDLYDIGHQNVTNIDISQVVIRQMSAIKDKSRPGLNYVQMDALETTFENESFSVVLDKGTLDALMPDDLPKTKQKITQYFTEITRLLRKNGRFICISLLQSQILDILLEYFPKNNFIFRIVRCFDAEKKASENNENSMPVFMVVCTKFMVLAKPILELNLAMVDKMERISSAEEVVKHISSTQQAAFVCAGLKKTSIADENEVSLNLHCQGESTRYTLYVVDIPREPKNGEYAAFVVPQGREAEWLFSTPAGRKQLAKMNGHNRLCIITLHRDQQYESLEKIQEEVISMVCSLRPSTLKDTKIVFYSTSSDVGQREIRYKGTSTMSGDYIIEDVLSAKQKYRRLFFLNNQLVIQSEAKLKTKKVRKSLKEIVDLNYLTCQHHIFMSLASNVLEQPNSLVVIGLGGGGLCSFLRKFLPQNKIYAVEIDEEMVKIAKEWFGFKNDDLMEVIVKDGLDFLQEKAEEKRTFGAILFDVDSKDRSIGMSCPPKEFLSEKTLQNVKQLIGDEGLFILNVVIRDQSLRPKIMRDLRNNFGVIISYKLEVDLNEIILATNRVVKEAKLKETLLESCRKLNEHFKKTNCLEIVFDEEDFLSRV